MQAHGEKKNLLDRSTQPLGDNCPSASRLNLKKFSTKTRHLSPKLAYSFDPRGVKMIRKLKSGKYRLYSSKKDPKTGKRKNLGTFDSRAAAEKHERDVQYFKRAG